MAKTALKKTTETSSKKTEAKEAKLEAKATKKTKKVEAASDKVPTITKACKIQSCKRRYKAKGYCVSHYREWRHGKFGKVRFKQCADINCSKPMAKNRHGYCEEHFQSFYVKGNAVTKAAPAADTKVAPAKTDTAAAAS